MDTLFIPEQHSLLSNNAAHEPDELSSGIKLDQRYQVVGTIGRGSTGVVYRAVQLSTGRHCAVKVLNWKLIADKRKLLRFREEILSHGCLNHPNIVTMHDAGETSTHQPYLVMELVGGDTMANFLAAGRRPTMFVSITIAQQIARALQHAHELGVVHRDLKPSNIMLHNNQVKIIDFSIARRAPALVNEKLTQTGEVIGTPAYMSPEQCQSSNVDLRSDVYSLGIVLYEMLTGKQPFKGQSVVETMQKHMSEAMPTFHSLGITHVPESLERIVGRCLAKNPADRYQTMESLADDLEAAERSLRAERLRYRRCVQAGRKNSEKRKLALVFFLATAALVFGIQIVNAVLYELSDPLSIAAREIECLSVDLNVSERPRSMSRRNADKNVQTSVHSSPVHSRHHRAEKPHRK